MGLARKMKSRFHNRKPPAVDASQSENSKRSTSHLEDIKVECIGDDDSIASIDTSYVLMEVDGKCGSNSSLQSRDLCTICFNFPCACGFTEAGMAEANSKKETICSACKYCDDVCGDSSCVECVDKLKVNMETDIGKISNRYNNKRDFTVCMIRRHNRIGDCWIVSMPVHSCYIVCDDSYAILFMVLVCISSRALCLQVFI